MPSPADCVYSNSHEWHRVSGDTVTVGLTRYAVDALTDVTYVSVKPAGTAFAAGKPVGEVESVKTTSDVYCSCAGEITEVNKAVVDDPSKLNADPFANWLFKAKITDKAGLAACMDAAAYDKQYPTG
jgi:glycine cleavage system H protein